MATDAKVALIWIKLFLSVNTTILIKLLTVVGQANIILLERPQQLLNILKLILETMAIIKMEKLLLRVKSASEWFLKAFR